MNNLIGIQGNQTKIVEKKDTAIHHGSGLLEVFATPAMIALMENTAYKSIEDKLGDGKTSVGIQINVQHKKASLPGAIITCNSKVENVDGKKVYFRITAFDEGEIGSAEHIRYIIDKKEFINKLNKK